MGGEKTQKPSGGTQDVSEVLENAALYFQGIEHSGLAELVGMTRELVFQIAPMTRRNGRWFLKTKNDKEGFLVGLKKAGMELTASLADIKGNTNRTNELSNR